MPNVKRTRYYEDFSPEPQPEQTAQEWVSLKKEPVQSVMATENTSAPTPQSPGGTGEGQNTAQENAPAQVATPITAEPANPGGSLTYATQSDTFAPENSQGEILVQAVTSRGTRPVTEAAVIITANRNGSQEVVSESFTNKDGRTPLISVPAPAGADSQTPTDTLPFADYNITVRHPLYYVAEIKDVQVFGDQLSIQVTELIPLPEFVNENNITQTVDIPKQNL